MDSPVDGDEVTAAKAAIRAEMRSRRAGLGADELAAAGAAVSARLRALPAMQTAGLVAAYRAVRGEIPLEDLIDGPGGPADDLGDIPSNPDDEPEDGPDNSAEGPPPNSNPAPAEPSRAPLDQVRYTLPRVSGRDLEFVIHQPGQPFEPGAFAIPEPVGGEVVALADHDVVLVPVVAFDADGYRVGQGQGFYDRALATLPAPRPNPGPVLIGIAHSFQQIAKTPRHPWDIPLDAIATESGLIEVSPRP